LAQSLKPGFSLWKNFKEMPLILKFLTVHAVACLFFIVSSIFPHNSFSVEGSTVSYFEWWSSGAGTLATIFGTLFPLSGYLLLKRASIARVFYLSSMLIAFYSPVLFIEGSKYPGGYYISSLLLVLLLAGYLYLGKTAKAYFSSEGSLKATA